MALYLFLLDHSSVEPHLLQLLYILNNLHPGQQSAMQPRQDRVGRQLGGGREDHVFPAGELRGGELNTGSFRRQDEDQLWVGPPLVSTEPGG